MNIAQKLFKSVFKRRVFFHGATFKTRKLLLRARFFFKQNSLHLLKSFFIHTAPSVSKKPILNKKSSKKEGRERRGAPRHCRWMRVGLSLRREIRSAPKWCWGVKTESLSARLSTNGLSTDLKPLQPLYHSWVLLAEAALPPKRERT